MLPVSSDSPIDRIAEMLPNIIGSVKSMMKSDKESEEKEKDCGCSGKIHY